MINVVIDNLSIPLALGSIIKNLHFDMPSIMLISPVGISQRSENQSTDQDEHSSFVKGPFYESKTMNLNQHIDVKSKTAVRILNSKPSSPQQVPEAEASQECRVTDLACWSKVTAAYLVYHCTVEEILCRFTPKVRKDKSKHIDV